MYVEDEFKQEKMFKEENGKKSKVYPSLTPKDKPVTDVNTKVDGYW